MDQFKEFCLPEKYNGPIVSGSGFDEINCEFVQIMHKYRCNVQILHKYRCKYDHSKMQKHIDAWWGEIVKDRLSAACSEISEWAEDIKKIYFGADFASGPDIGGKILQFGVGAVPPPRYVFGDFSRSGPETDSDMDIEVKRSESMHCFDDEELLNAACSEISRIVQKKWAEDVTKICFGDFGSGPDIGGKIPPFGVGAVPPPRFMTRAQCQQHIIDSYPGASGKKKGEAWACLMCFRRSHGQRVFPNPWRYNHDRTDFYNELLK